MRTGIDPRDEIRVYDPGYVDGAADIVLTRPILTLMGLNETQPILVRVRDDHPKQIEILGPATPDQPSDPYTVTARPDPNNDPHFPSRFNCQLPSGWKLKHRPQSKKDMNEWGDDPYRQIEVDYTTEVARTFLREDRTLVIPL